MTLEEFINENRGELRDCILNVLGQNFDVDDEEIEDWIMNDEGLYNWMLENCDEDE
jgi:succinate dehydrogenase flavin-adding protein (antitoxin of CptAB toxin-antitoxin module)